METKIIAIENSTAIHNQEKKITDNLQDDNTLESIENDFDNEEWTR